MPSVSGTGWTVICLLLWTPVAAQSGDMHCSVAPVQGLQRHPVQGLLERFEAGPGCEARGHGKKETRVVAVEKATHPENKVTVLLKPLSLSPSPLRPLHLLLSSKHRVSWWLEAERLPPSLPVLVQVSSNSSVHSHGLRLRVQKLPFLPFRARALHRWALKRHRNVSSLTHATYGNRVYVALGEDPALPAVCRLQPLFVSHNYVTSDLQPQEVQGCVHAAAGEISPEVHVIKLHSAGSALCGSLQVEVLVSLVPPAGHLKPQKVVLILSSSLPVNWAVSARGVRGDVSVHSSNSVSPPFPPEPDLTVSSTIVSDLSTVSDLLVWARERGYTEVSSYTEADLANRFVIQLAGGGTDVAALMRPLWAEEHRLRQGLKDGVRVQCEDGLVSLTVDLRILQASSDQVTAVTLRDPACQAQSNGSHFLLVFPVISCGTEGLLLGQSRGVRYQNTVLLWSDEPRSILALDETEQKSKRPLSLHLSCVAALPGPANDTDETNSSQTVLTSVSAIPETNPELSRLPTSRHRSGPVLLLKLFFTKSYEQRRVGPCVVAADQRVYAEVSARGPLSEVVRLKSCVVSPLSDPKKSPFWFVMNEGCSSDPSLTFVSKTKDAKEEGAEGRGTRKGPGKTEKGGLYPRDDGKAERREEEPTRMTKSGTGTGDEGEVSLVRFSFILRPVYNDSVQFVHCSLHLCDSTSDESRRETVKTDCRGRSRVPALVSESPGHKCEIRNLSRPMVVTQFMSSLVPKASPVGQRTRRLSLGPQASPDPEDSSSVLQTGPVIGIVFLAFVMGVALMGGLWCIYSHTGGRPASPGRLTDQEHGVRHIGKPPSVSDQPCSSV
ncbi:hypothetical protein Q5P01_017781 [Channa striata]|uniref:ZP domain-containing protein n=1 Tax=Channa striata TaxID=64152 RepID=A0AA88MDQ2_CHASR|nr:hypothetical protein Q5P01_017781 [Channa striata]